MISRIVELNGNEIKLSCSALVPRLYRRATNRDLIMDMMRLRDNYNKSVKAQIKLKERAAAENRDIDPDELQAAQLSAIDLEIFEDLAWAFVKDANPTTPGTPDEWLNTLEGMFSIYKIFPIMIDLWNDTNKQTSMPAKK